MILLGIDAGQRLGVAILDGSGARPRLVDRCTIEASHRHELAEPRAYTRADGSTVMHTWEPRTDEADLRRVFRELHALAIQGVTRIVLEAPVTVFGDDVREVQSKAKRAIDTTKIAGEARYVARALEIPLVEVGNNQWRPSLVAWGKRRGLASVPPILAAEVDGWASWCVEERAQCIACEGSGVRSIGGPCGSCGGSGNRPTGDHEWNAAGAALCEWLRERGEIPRIGEKPASSGKANGPRAPRKRRREPKFGAEAWAARLAARREEDAVLATWAAYARSLGWTWQRIADALGVPLSRVWSACNVASVAESTAGSTVFKDGLDTCNVASVAESTAGSRQRGRGHRQGAPATSPPSPSRLPERGLFAEAMQTGSRPSCNVASVAESTAGRRSGPRLDWHSATSPPSPNRLPEL